MTFLSTLHPYPAMIADEVAEQVCRTFAKRDFNVLDPFCGTARTLVAAADRGAAAWGFDVNPLAVMIAEAKFAKPSLSWLSNVVRDLPSQLETDRILDFHQSRKVRWFSPKVVLQLSGLVQWLAQRPDMRRAEWLLLAAVLSATAREVSYCRKDQWKLHRMSKYARRRYRPDTVAVFRRRLDRVVREIADGDRPSGKGRISRGSALSLRSALGSGSPRRFELVFTSPPYGDSLSTVQYGGISSLCLAVIRHLAGVSVQWQRQSEIDSASLGGQRRMYLPEYSAYWHGGAHSAGVGKVTSFLADLSAACDEIASVVSPGGVVVFVVGRRRVGRFRVYSDQLIVKTFRDRGFDLLSNEARRIRGKMTPVIVSRAGVGNRRRAAVTAVRTMEQEQILILRRS